VVGTQDSREAHTSQRIGHTTATSRPAGSGQANLAKSVAKKVVLVPGSHHHFCTKQAGNGQSFSGKQVQPVAGAIELVRHRRCHLPPTEHLSLVGQFQHCTQGPLALTRRQQEKRTRQCAACATDNGLTQTQVPAARREDPVVGPGDLFAQECGKCLVINQDRQG